MGPRKAHTMFQHSIHAALVTALMLGATLLASPLHAQEVAAAEAGSFVIQTSGPEATASPFTLYRMPAPDFSADQADSVRTGRVDPLDLDQNDELNAGPNVALMAVGGAALVTGLLIGGDAGTAVAITGGAIGLVGLYRFLR